MYLPKFKQRPATYTAGNEYFVQETGEEYIGFYVVTSKGEAYTGKTIERGFSKKLLSFKETPEQPAPLAEVYDFIKKDSESFALKQTEELPRYIPVKNDLVPFINRFFAKSRVTGTIIEISRETYLELQSKSTKYHHPSYQIVTLNWYISFPVEDITTGPYKQKGSRTKNLEEITKAEKALPGIAQYLSDPTELIL